MSKVDLISNAWCDLVFEGRNQTYGAYKLRKGTGKRNLWSLLIVLIAAVVIFSAIAIKNVIQANQRVAVTTGVELSQIQTKKQPNVEKKTPVKIEQPKQVERVKSSIKFTAPVIKKDEDVKPEEEMQNQDDLQKSKTAIGALNVQGNDEIGGTVLKIQEEIAQPEPPKEEENKVFDVVEEQPSFPGGQGALMQWLSDNIKYPVIAAENGVQGRVIVQFVVSKTGSISDVKVVRGVDPSLDREAVRVVSQMPKWTPGRQNGTTVNVRYTLPVTFRLQ